MGSQLFSGTKELGHHRAGADVQLFGDFIAAEAANHLQHQGLGVFALEFHHRLAREVDVHQLIRGAVTGIFHIRYHVIQAVDDRLFFLKLPGKLATQDGEYPTFGRFLVFQRIDRTPGPQVRFLYQVFGHVLVFAQPIGKPIQVLVVDAQQGIKLSFFHAHVTKDPTIEVSLQKLITLVMFFFT